MLAKSTEYAIRALVYIQIQSWNKQRPGVVEIAKKIDAPEAFSAKILQTLTRHKLLSSVKGRGGGFFFSDNESNLTIYDVIHVMEGDECLHQCGFGLKNCNKDNPCPLHEKYIIVREEYYKIVKSETISSLAQRISRGEAVLNNSFS
jgi:Rrf2 family protein